MKILLLTSILSFSQDFPSRKELIGNHIQQSQILRSAQIQNIASYMKYFLAGGYNSICVIPHLAKMDSKFTDPTEEILGIYFNIWGVRDPTHYKIPDCIGNFFGTLEGGLRGIISPARYIAPKKKSSKNATLILILTIQNIYSRTYLGADIGKLSQVNSHFNRYCKNKLNFLKIRDFHSLEKECPTIVNNISTQLDISCPNVLSISMPLQQYLNSDHTLLPNLHAITTDFPDSPSDLVNAHTNKLKFITIKHTVLSKLDKSEFLDKYEKLKKIFPGVTFTLYVHEHRFIPNFQSMRSIYVLDPYTHNFILKKVLK